jgi:heparosan-N-sulfate-glucuronate 5-epimerase
MIRKRLNYLKRVYQAYLSGEDSQLTFWHGKPMVNQDIQPGKVGQYYMSFAAKAEYNAHLDDQGVPLLDYHGSIGLQYNPIAIAQYGLGNYNLYHQTGEEWYRSKLILAANWLKENLVKNSFGVPVWMHHFDFEYQEGLTAPWYSGLAQGQGVSTLLRAYQTTQNEEYLKAAEKAFSSLLLPVSEGGVITHDEDGYLWIEEYIVSVPTRVLNGYIWALWGVYDYYLLTGADQAKDLYLAAVKTLSDNLQRYDTGYWSLYDLSSERLKMIASPFYHQLHIVQLKVMYQLTGEENFKSVAERWESYQKRILNRWRAFLQKLIFKALYY